MKRHRPYAEIELIDKDGNVYPLSFPTRLNQAISGLGMPPINHWAVRSPFQTGQSHWGYAIAARPINIVLYSRGCDRADMYTKRRANIQMLSPRNSPHKLRLITPEWQQYELHNVWYVGGYELSSQEQPQPNIQVGAIQLIAYDPIWKWVNAPLDAGETRDAEGRICVETDTFVLTQQLQLAFTGPFLLGTTVGTATLTCTNDGSWAILPLITITGPTDDWILTNDTGTTLSCNAYPISDGETVTIDVAAKTVTNGDGTNLISYISGDVGTFALEPGANLLTFRSLNGAINGTTTISVCWFVEFLGI